MGEKEDDAPKETKCRHGNRQVFLSAVKEQFFFRHPAKLLHGEAVSLAGDQKDRGDEHAKKCGDAAEKIQRKIHSAHLMG